MLRIIDCSAWQGNSVDWAGLAQQGIAGGIAKASEGNGYRDPTLSRNASAISTARMQRGFYHFSRVDLGTTAQAEAAWFLLQLPSLDAGDLLILDLETPTSGAGNYDAWALAWLSIVEKATGVVPWLYTGPWYAQGLGRLSSPDLARHPLWNAAYGPAPAPPAYSPWSHVSLWQHTDRAGPYAGVGTCDESLFDGTFDQLRALGYPAPKTPAPPPQQAKHLQLDVAMHLRPQPRVDAMPLGPLLPAGTKVVELPLVGGGAVEQNGWAHCRTSGDVSGWLLLQNMRAYQPSGTPG